MIIRRWFLIIALILIPGTALAVEIISNEDMAAITGEAGIVFDDLAAMPLEEISEILTCDEVQSLSEAERQQLWELIVDKFAGLSEQEKAQLRERISRRLHERISEMTPADRQRLAERRRQREEYLASMPQEERNRLFQQMKEKLNCISLTESTEFRQRMQERMADMSAEDLDRLIQLRQLQLRLGTCCPFRR